MNPTVFSRLGWLGSAVVAVVLAGVVGLAPRVHADGQGPQAMGLTPATAAELQALEQASAQGLDYVPGEVIFKFKKGTLPVFQQRALSAIRSRPRLADVRWAHEIGMLRDDTQPDSRVLAQQLSEQNEVEYAHPNYIRRTGPVARALASSLEGATPTSGSVPAISGQPFTPNDPDFSLLQWNFPLVTMPGAWGINAGGSSTIKVAVIDTGVTSAPLTLTTPLWNGSAFVSTVIPFAGSPDLSASRIVSPHDFVFNTATNVVLDMDGHATHVSSTIGEDTNNSLALAGIAFNVQIMPIKVCSGYWESMIQRGIAGTPGFTNVKAAQCPDSAIIAGVELAADSGAKVINISLGGDQPEPGLQTAIQDAVNKGAFVAIAMGNDFTNGNPTEFPAFYAAAIDGAMSVASVSSTMAHAAYSSSGSYCEISAPGGDGPGNALTSFVWQGTLNFNDQSQLLVAPRFDRYAEVGYEGTSMASPHVAGLAALIMSQYPGIKPAQVEALIKRTAMNIGDKNLFGSGLIQARAALFGFGIAK